MWRHVPYIADFRSLAGYLLFVHILADICTLTIELSCAETMFSVRIGAFLGNVQ